jgi:hypothetical protein
MTTSPQVKAVRAGGGANRDHKGGNNDRYAEAKHGCCLSPAAYEDDAKMAVSPQYAMEYSNNSVALGSKAVPLYNGYRK